MPDDCYQCIFYSMYDGICMNPNSPYYGDDRICESACDEFVKEEEE